MRWFAGILLAVAVTLPNSIRFRADGASVGNDRAIGAKLGDIISVKDPHGSTPGAVGDGVTDDTTAYNSAVTAAGSAGGVSLPCPGSYKINGTVLACGGVYQATGAGSVPLSIASKLGQVVYAAEYGAKCDNSTDDTTALTAALTAVGSGILYLPVGTCKFSSTLSLPNRVRIAGGGRGTSILKYTGSGTAIAQATPGTRVFDIELFGISVTTTTGAIGLDLADVSTSLFEQMLVTGFSDTGIYIHGASAGNAAYNRFIDVTVSLTPTCWKVAGNASNANDFIYPRANVCSTRGFDLQDSNDLEILGGQIEGSGVGVFIDCAVLGACDGNRIRDTRFEANTTGIQINSANVRDVGLSGIYNSSNGTNLTDSGTTTRRLEQVFSVSSAGQVNMTGGTFVAASSIALGTTSSSLLSASAAPLYMRGQAGVNGVGNYIGNTTTLTGSPARPVCFTDDTPVTHAVIAACIDINGSYIPTGVTFANIATGSTANSTLLWCSDCTPTSVCAGGGNGAFAERVNGAWTCNGGVVSEHDFSAYNAANLAGATAFAQTVVTNASTVTAGSTLTHDIAGAGTGTFVAKLCSDGVTCGAGNVYLTCTAGATCAAAVAGRIDACTVTKAAVPAATTLTWSVATACGTTDPGINAVAHFTTP